MQKLKQWGTQINTQWMRLPKWARFVLRLIAIIITAPVWIPGMIVVVICAGISIAVIDIIVEPLVDAWKKYK